MRQLKLTCSDSFYGFFHISSRNLTESKPANSVTRLGDFWHLYERLGYFLFQPHRVEACQEQHLVASQKKIEQRFIKKKQQSLFRVPPQLGGIVCAFYPAAPGSDPKHAVNASKKQSLFRQSGWNWFAHSFQKLDLAKFTQKFSLC